MNPQNIVRSIFAAVTIVSTVIVIKDHNATINAERAKREQIRRNLQRELAAQARANLKVQQKVLAGDYNRNLGSAVEDLAYDIKFYRIIDRIND